MAENSDKTSLNHQNGDPNLDPSKPDVFASDQQGNSNESGTIKNSRPDFIDNNNDKSQKSKSEDPANKEVNEDNTIFRDVARNLNDDSKSDIEDGELPASRETSPGLTNYPRSPKRLTHIPQERPEVVSKHKENIIWTAVMNEFEVEVKVDNTHLDDGVNNAADLSSGKKWIDMDKPNNHNIIDSIKEKEKSSNIIKIQEMFKNESQRVKNCKDGGRCANSNQRPASSERSDSSRGRAIYREFSDHSSKRSHSHEHLDHSGRMNAASSSSDGEGSLSSSSNNNGSRRRNRSRSSSPRHTSGRHFNHAGSREYRNAGNRNRLDAGPQEGRRSPSSAMSRRTKLLRKGELSVHDRLGKKCSVHDRLSMDVDVDDGEGRAGELGSYDAAPHARTADKRRADESSEQHDSHRRRRICYDEHYLQPQHQPQPHRRPRPHHQQDKQNPAIAELQVEDRAKKPVKDRIGFKQDPNLCFSEDSDADFMAKEMTKALGEKDEMIIILDRIIEVLGRKKTMELYNDVDMIFNNGGLLMKNSNKKRSKGGVFFTLFKESANEDEYIFAFEEFKKLQKQKKKLEKENKLELTLMKSIFENSATK